MSFTPSEHFNERWLQSPDVIKQTILDELDDIKKLLDPKTAFANFCFSTPDLHQTLHQMQAIHLEAIRQETKKRKQQHLQEILPVLEKRLEQKTNELVMERLAGLDSQLQEWLKDAIEQALEDI